MRKSITKEEIQFLISLCGCKHPDLGIFIQDKIDYAYSMSDFQRQWICDERISLSYSKDNHFSLLPLNGASIKTDIYVVLKDQGYHPWVITKIGSNWLKTQDFKAVAFDQSPFDYTPSEKSFKFSKIILPMWSMPMPDLIQSYMDGKRQFINKLENLVNL